MLSLKKILNFYIFSNIHVSLAGYCLTKVTVLKYGISNSLVPLFVAFSIVISYNFIRYYELKTERLLWFKDWFYLHGKKIAFITFLSTVFLGYIIFFSDFKWQSLVILIPFAFMTFFYVVPLFKVGNIEGSFRNFPSIKIFSIAISWAGVSVLFPLYEKGYEFTPEVYIEFFQRFLILIAITIPFDIRDLNLDSRNLKTLPQVFGVKKLKTGGVFLIFIFIVLELLKTTNSAQIIVTLLISLITGFFLWNSSPSKSRYYASFWVESIPIVWFVLTFVFL